MTSNDDLAAFRAEVAGILPLVQDRILPARRQRRKIRHAALDADPPLNLSPYSDLYEPVAGDQPRYCHRDLPANQFRRFLRKRDPVDAWLDLHGQSVEQVQHRLPDFLLQSRLRKQNLVCILHGKGQGILRQRLLRWLPQDESVLAFDIAHDRHGGSGALLVLLRSL